MTPVYNYTLYWWKCTHCDQWERDYETIETAQRHYQRHLKEECPLNPTRIPDPL